MPLPNSRNCVAEAAALAAPVGVLTGAPVTIALAAGTVAAAAGTSPVRCAAAALAGPRLLTRGTTTSTGAPEAAASTAAAAAGPVAVPTRAEAAPGRVERGATDRDRLTRLAPPR